MTLKKWLVITQNDGVSDTCFKGQKETLGSLGPSVVPTFPFLCWLGGFPY